MTTINGLPAAGTLEPQDMFPVMQQPPGSGQAVISPGSTRFATLGALAQALGTTIPGGPLFTTGGTMTGPLEVLEPAGVHEPVTLNYLTQHPYLPVAGGTMLGALTLAGAPTAPLQAATKQYVDTNSLTQTTADARYLQLSGGTVTGQTTFTGGNNASGPFVFAHQSVSGTVPSGQGANWYAFNIDNDAADASAAQGGGAHGAYFGHNVVAGAKGGRTGLTTLLVQSGATASPTGTYYVAMGAFSQASYSAGGTSGSPQGALFGFNCGATVATGATNWTSAVGAEIDVCVQSGANVAYKSGLSIVQFNNDAVRGSVDDYAIGIGMQGFAPQAPGWTTGLQFGGATGWWPFTANSTMVGTKASSLTGGPAMLALNGIDLSAVTFSGNAFMSNNFHVAAGGRVHTDGGIDCGNTAASGVSDLSHHIALYSGFGFSITANSLNLVTGAGSILNFVVGSSGVATVDANGFEGPIGQGTPNAATVAYLMIGTGGPTWTSGTAAPSSVQPVGSIYSRVGGAVGATLYVSRGGGTWNAVAGV